MVNDSTDSAATTIPEYLQQIYQTSKAQFTERRTILSFDEYLSIVAQKPKLHFRSSAQYIADVIQYFGNTPVKHATGTWQRYHVFDAPYDDGRGRVAGQERVQEDFLRALYNFVRSGRTDRLILLHGPNGSAKTSMIQSMIRAAEAYSYTDDGALYRFNWVFPIASVQKGKLGFGGGSSSKSVGSYAHLESAAIEARVTCEFKDHPLLLLTPEQCRHLFAQLQQKNPDGMPIQMPELLRSGDLSPKNRKIFDALLLSYHGDVAEVLRHVQVERFYLSKRYRTGIHSVEPQMSVDAHSRQVTADRSLGMLPASMQHVSLFETMGALNDAHRGIVEYNDLLKRPLEAWKYLLVATEQGQASLEHVSLFLDMVFLASSNEVHLEAFKQHHDWPSFKGRFELVKVPYLLRASDELQVYNDQIPRALTGVHIAPRALEIAARWAVLTRLEPPDPERYPATARKLIADLSAMEKLELYDTGAVPERLSQKDRRELRQLASKIYEEYRDRDDYEGRYGASVREMRTVILNAAQDKRYDHLAPSAIIDELSHLVRAKSSYEFLRREPVRGYRDPARFVEQVEDYYLRVLAEDIRQAMGLVAAEAHAESFERYLKHISAWLKKEKILDSVTNRLGEADVELMKRIEEVLLASHESADEFRRSTISQIGAYRLEHPDDPVDYDLLFSSHIRRLKEDYYKKRQALVERIEQGFLRTLDGDDKDIDAKDREQIVLLRSNLYKMGYTDASARTAIAFLLKKRRV